MKLFLISLPFLFLSFSVLAQPSDNLNRKAIGEILQNGEQPQKDSLIKAIITDGKKNKSDRDLVFYYNILTNLKYGKEAAAVQKRAIRLYPKGLMARAKDMEQYYQMKSLADKKKQYDDILKKYPIENFPGDEIMYDYVTSSLAEDLVKDGQKEAGLAYLDNMREKFWRAQAYIPIATILVEQGDTASALPLIQQSIEDAESFIKSGVQDNKAKFAAVGYPDYVQMYAAILMTNGKDEEAINTLEEAIAVAPEMTEQFFPVYAKALKKVGRNLEAFNCYSALYKGGQFEYNDTLQNLYVKLNNDNISGFERYLGSLRKELEQNIQKHLVETVIDKETPSFKLRNMNGETVDSKSLLGKIVVLDFWATWCGPCIRSFPGMQKAVSKYKEDPDVVFLFIDTWERDEDYEKNVKDFIAKNNYTFNVLFDDGQMGEELAPQFGISGIPAKFVIDKNGKTRFFLTGSSPIADYILMEVSQMIEYVRNEK